MLIKKSVEQPKNKSVYKISCYEVYQFFQDACFKENNNMTAEKISK